ncbi:Holliday junction branch migration protein RuvA [Fodinicurvata sediminis]|uniref:Holliday junction branch migration protein RuvA n=1 Tax=Fodinicurvata sediminis TaxID=1121832 RepID=UPI0003B31544|nr:Holliday junction branch migration protein RuvA [Fodinicurvata sediminis]
MIGKLTGTVDQPAEDHVILDVGGVGYIVFCSARTLSALPSMGESASLLIETHVREDHIHLYGFAESLEREWFRLLSGVQGVGARMALAILSILPPLSLAQAIAAQDRASLTRANGVGPKLAARVISELMDKAGQFATTESLAHEVTSGAAAVAPSGEAGMAGQAEDAVSALVNLGYRRTEAFAAVSKTAREQGEGASLQGLIREALRELSS